VVNLGSYTRSAARATFSAYRSIPIRWRLAGGSAVLTFVILACFAAIVGVLTTRQVRGQFNNDVRAAGEQLKNGLHLKWITRVSLNCNKTISLSDYVSAEHAQIRIFDDEGGLLCTQDNVKIKGQKTSLPAVPAFPPPARPGAFEELGYLVVAREVPVQSDGQVMLLYARPLSDIDRTLARVRVFLLLGVLGGTILALVGGLWTARRAMRPVVELTDAAREIERTRDPSREIPYPEAEDEVAELARTLDGMLRALDSARSETEGMLSRQREFVADASHELRTPLTSVLANLDLLADELVGEQAETAEAALRATRRMRRLVGDLLLLARADAERTRPHRPTDMAEVLTEAAAELGPVAEDHELSIDARPAMVAGVKDDLHRLTLNLLENSVRHTPPGTHIRARVDALDGVATLIVEDDGPGIAPELQHRVFDRFVRGAGDGGRGSGLGLSIVRAVAESHGGAVALERPSDGRGTRFIISIPTDSGRADARLGSSPNGESADAQTSTTTGSTIGRLRKRS
jgi:two-component system OmpR family sensor kinase